MEIDWTTVLTALIASLVTVLPGLYALTRQRKKDKAETVKLRAETADKIIATSKQQVDISLSLIKPLREKANDLESRISNLEKELQELKERNVDLQEVCAQLFRGCNRLNYQVRSLNAEPVFRPSRDIQAYTEKEDPSL